MVGQRTQLLDGLCHPLLGVLGSIESYGHFCSLSLFLRHDQVLADPSVFDRAPFYLYLGTAGSWQALVSFSIQSNDRIFGCHHPRVVDGVEKSSDSRGIIQRIATGFPIRACLEGPNHSWPQQWVVHRPWGCSVAHVGGDLHQMVSGIWSG